MKIGAFRRIDNLGRIVIPKSVRKTLNIKSGDNLQIYVSEDNIIIKKHSELSNIENILSSINEIFKSQLNKEIYITDTEKIISPSSEKDTFLIEEFMSLLNTRKIVTQNIKITEKSKTQKLIINPIIINGDLLGSLALITDENLTEKELSTVNSIIKLIQNILDN